MKTNWTKEQPRLSIWKRLWATRQANAQMEEEAYHMGLRVRSSTNPKIKDRVRADFMTLKANSGYNKKRVRAAYKKGLLNKEL